MIPSLAEELFPNQDTSGHRLDSFGDLLQYGTYQVIKGGTSSGKDEEREVRS
jgi:hypothetical protein